MGHTALYSVEPEAGRVRVHGGNRQQKVFEGRGKRFFRHFLINACLDGCRTKDNYTRQDVSPATTYAHNNDVPAPTSLRPYKVTTSLQLLRVNGSGISSRFQKAIIAALNGHAFAGGCMIAAAVDHRIMATGKAKISLNEVTFGSTFFAGIVEILKRCVGAGNAEKILYSGRVSGIMEVLNSKHVLRHVWRFDPPVGKKYGILLQ